MSTMIKKIRCPYFELNDLERAYHDKKWVRFGWRKIGNKRDFVCL